MSGRRWKLQNEIQLKFENLRFLKSNNEVDYKLQKYICKYVGVPKPPLGGITELHTRWGLRSEPWIRTNSE
jgi:hypothetical protein